MAKRPIGVAGAVGFCPCKTFKSRTPEAEAREARAPEVAPAAAPAAAPARPNVVIVGRCADGSTRVFSWDVSGTGPDNTWVRLCAVVDRNEALPRHELPPGALIRLQAAMVESVDVAEETAVRP